MKFATQVSINKKKALVRIMTQHETINEPLFQLIMALFIDACIYVLLVREESKYG